MAFDSLRSSGLFVDAGMQRDDPLAVYVRKKAGGLAIRNTLTGLARAVRRLPMANPARHDVEVIKDIPYLNTGLVEHTYDVWRPKPAPGQENAPLPLAFYIHGGAFRALSKDTHWIMGLALARRGFVVALPNYRLAPKHRYPAGSADAVAALTHVLKNAQRFGIDADNVVITGESAGANITLGIVTGICFDVPAPHLDAIRDVTFKAAIPACGVFDVGDPERFRRHDPRFHWFFNDRVHELTAWLPRQGGEVLRDDPIASPLPFLETAPVPKKPLPPMFLPVGGGDFLVDDHVRLHRALKAIGHDNVDFAVYGREPHAFQAFVWRKEARRFWAEQAAFLRKHGLPVREPPPI